MIESLPALLLVAAAFQIILTLYRGYWFWSQDSQWYPFRVVEYTEAWRGGSLYPRWCPDFFGGYGYPLFNYYPIAMFASAAALTILLGVGPIAALKLMLCLFIPAAGLGVYGLAYGETRRADAALISGFVYLFLPYRFTDLFLRGDLNEFAAYSIVPFALWGYRALGRIRADRRPLVGALTAVAHGAVWFFHPLIGLLLAGIVAILLPLQVVLADDRRVGWRQALFGGCIALLATIIASVYLAPALLELSLVRLENLRQFTQPTTKYLVGWRALVDPDFHCAGSPTMVGAVVLAVGLMFAPLRRKLTSAVVWWLPALLCLSLTTDFWFSVWFWRVLPFGKLLLYPFRLLGFAGLFAAVGIGLTWSSLISVEWRTARWVGAIALSLIIAVSSNGYNRAEFVAFPTADQLKPDAIRGQDLITTVADEFLPRTITKPHFERRKIVSANATARLLLPGMSPVHQNPMRVQATEIGPLRYSIEARASQPGFFDLYVFDFPGWKVDTRKGPAPARQSTSPTGLIRLSLPAAGYYQLTVYFGSTPLRTVSALASLSAFLLVYPVLWYLGRNLFGIHPGSLSR